MKKYFFISILFAFAGTKISAQFFSKTITPSTNSYIVSLPVDAPNWIPTTSTDATPKAANSSAPMAACFIEFGDGAFSFLPNGDHTFNPSFTSTIITKVTGVYGGGGKPPSHVAKKELVAPTMTSTYQPMSVLTPGQQVFVTPNIGSVVAKDTMIFVITYKLEESQIGKNCSLLFLYNDGGPNDIFYKISTGQSFVDKNSGSSVIVNHVRTYYGESETGLSVDATSFRNRNNQYADYIAISSLAADTLEHNVFVTLIPKDAFTGLGVTQTNVKAMLITPALRKPGIAIATENETNLPIQELSHDPNYITVKPTCMLLPKENHSLDYHLHFQNTGVGIASKVHVKIKIPDGVDFLNDISYSSTSPWFKIKQGTIVNSAPFKFTNLYHDSLYFEIEPNSTSAGCTLLGMSNNPNFLCNDGTTGDIWFTIKTKSTSPDILLAQASIVFFNSDGSKN